MCFPCLFCLLLYLHRYCTCFLINLNFDLFVLYHFISISIPLVFLDLVVHFGVPFGYLPVDILCARFGPLLLSFWNQDSYSWLKLPIFGCIQFLYNLEPRGRSPWWFFPIVKTFFPFLEQCGQYLTCDCYMLDQEFGNHPLHALRRNLLSFH